MKEVEVGEKEEVKWGILCRVLRTGITITVNTALYKRDGMELA